MNPYEIYQRNQEMVDSKEDLLLKTFDGIFSKLGMIRYAIEQNDIVAKAQEISKLVDVLEVMRASLDFEKGGEIAKNLDAIYAFCIDELIKANIKNEMEYIDNVIETLTPIKEGFEAVAKK